jgi:hypothetical protein
MWQPQLEVEKSFYTPRVLAGARTLFKENHHVD